jgi:hypothetical protein
MIHSEIRATEEADRLAIRELVDAYAHYADRRDPEGQKSLFTEDTHVVVYMEGQGSEPTQVLDGREALTPVFDDLNRYQALMHFNGQTSPSSPLALTPRATRFSRSSTRWPRGCSGSEKPEWAHA